MQLSVPTDIDVAGVEQQVAVAGHDGHLKVARLKVRFHVEQVVQAVTVRCEGRRNEELVGFGRLGF